MTGTSKRSNRTSRLSVAALVLILAGMLAVPARAQLERVVADAKGIT
jgi:hypothetical protein